jgi:large subunit ribosomal protein L30
MSSTSKKKTKTRTQRKSPVKPKTPRKRVAPAKKTEPHPSIAPTLTPTPVKKEQTPEKSYLVAVRLKGGFGNPCPIARALGTLRLTRKFNAVLLEDTPASIGMLRAVKDYVTWGLVNKSDIISLLRERGVLSGGIAVTDQTTREKFGESSVQDLVSALTQGRVSLRTLWQKGLNPVFRLHPPSGGFDGSTKRAYGSRGELGRRQTTLMSLLTRMM